VKIYQFFTFFPAIFVTPFPEKVPGICGIFEKIRSFSSNFLKNRREFPFRLYFNMLLILSLKIRFLKKFAKNEKAKKTKKRKKRKSERAKKAKKRKKRKSEKSER
jgi:hypothetical protein